MSSLKVTDNFYNQGIDNEEIQDYTYTRIVDAVGKCILYFFLLIVFELLFGGAAISLKCFISENMLI